MTAYDLLNISDRCVLSNTGIDKKLLIKLIHHHEATLETGKLTMLLKPTQTDRVKCT